MVLDLAAYHLLGETTWDVYALFAFVPLIMLIGVQPPSRHSVRYFCIGLAEIFVIGVFLLMMFKLRHN
jgi:hypothetical protein